MAIRDDVEFALQQQAAFYKSQQWSLRTDSFFKAHEETRDLAEEIRGKEILNLFHSLYQEPFAVLVEEAVRVFTGIVIKLPGTSIKERTGIVEQHVKDSIIQPNIRKGPVERWLMQASGWKGDPAILIGNDHVMPVKEEFALVHNMRVNNIPERLATAQLILELTTTLESRLMHV